METNKILELAKKLKALADRGIGGEKYNAQAKLNAILEKHGLTIQDLENVERHLAVFAYKKGEGNIMSHIIWKVAGEDIKLYGHKHKRQALIAEVTNAEQIEILALYNLYSRSLQQELKVFVKAFILKNDLATTGTPSSSAGAQETTPEERAKLRNMMDGITKRKAFKAQLNPKGS